MSRNLTAAVISAMQSASVRPVIFVTAQFASGTVNVWSGIGQIEWNGVAWTGLGYLGKISPIQETTSGQARGVTMELSGIPEDVIQYALTEVSNQYPVTIYIGYLDTSGNIIANPETRFAGRMDVVRIAEGGETSTIQINVESKLIDLMRARERHYTHEDQQIDFPGDMGFGYVNGIQQLSVIWGMAGTPINNLPTAASMGGNSLVGGRSVGSSPARPRSIP